MTRTTTTFKTATHRAIREIASACSFTSGQPVETHAPESIDKTVTCDLTEREFAFIAKSLRRKRYTVHVTRGEHTETW